MECQGECKNNGICKGDIKTVLVSGYGYYTGITIQNPKPITMQNKHTQNQVFYLIVDKQSKIVKDFTDKEQAENYVKERPYLRVSELDLTQPLEENESQLFQYEPDDLPF